MRETLAWQKVNRTRKNQCATPERNKLSTEHIQNIVWGTNVMNTPTENIQNSAQNTNVTKNQKEHSQNSAPDTNERNNQTEHIQNRGRGTNVTNCQQNKKLPVKITSQTVKKTHTKQCTRH